jgi:hypothetical protein
MSRGARSTLDLERALRTQQRRTRDHAARLRAIEARLDAEDRRRAVPPVFRPFLDSLENTAQHRGAWLPCNPPFSPAAIPRPGSDLLPDVPGFAGAAHCRARLFIRAFMARIGQSCKSCVNAIIRANDRAKARTR